MSLTVLVVDGKRFLINTESKASEKHCEEIIKSFPSDAVVEFDEVKKSDVMPKTLNELIQNN